MEPVYININSSIVAVVFLFYGFTCYVIGYIANSDRGGI